MFVEVKGTVRSEVDFFWTRNERCVAAEKGPDYWIYAFTHVDLSTTSAKGPSRIRNPFKDLEAKGYEVQPLDVRVRKR
jgi:hypothetical protein